MLRNVTGLFATIAVVVVCGGCGEKEKQPPEQSASSSPTPAKGAYPADGEGRSNEGKPTPQQKDEPKNWSNTDAQDCLTDESVHLFDSWVSTGRELSEAIDGDCLFTDDWYEWFAESIPDRAEAEAYVKSMKVTRECWREAGATGKRPKPVKIDQECRRKGAEAIGRTYDGGLKVE